MVVNLALSGLTRHRGAPGGGRRGRRERIPEKIEKVAGKFGGVILFCCETRPKTLMHARRAVVRLPIRFGEDVRRLRLAGENAVLDLSAERNKRPPQE